MARKRDEQVDSVEEGIDANASPVEATPAGSEPDEELPPPAPTAAAEALDLEGRLAAIRARRSELSAAADSVGMARAARLLAQPGSRETAAERNARAAVESEIQDCNAAIEMAESQLAALEPEIERERVTADEARRFERARRMAAALPAIGAQLDAVLRLVEQATEGDPEHRAALQTDVGRAYRDAVALSNVGRPASVVPALERKADELLRWVESRENPIAGPGSEQVPEVAIYALANFEYKLPGPRNAGRTIPAGTIIMIEPNAAARAVATRVAQILDQPGDQTMRVTMLRNTPAGEDRIWPADWRGALPYARARELIASGAAERRIELSPEEVAFHRREHSENLPRGKWIDLGMIDGASPTPPLARAGRGRQPDGETDEQRV